MTSRDEFVETLTDRAEGVNSSQAGSLHDAGYDTLDKLAEATVDDLTEIDGIGRVTAERVIEAAQAPAPTEGPKVKPDPELDEATEKALELRDKQNLPRFRRQNLGRFKKLDDKWRAPRGTHSRQREGKRYRPRRPRVGYRGPKEARGLHPSGFEEVLVHNAEDLDEVDPSTQAARIGGSVGKRKRVAILERADEMDIHVLNPGVS